MTVRIAVPNKGRLSESAARLMKQIGFPLPDSGNRTLLAEFGNGRYQVLLARAQDIPEFVEMGAADLGVTGLDLVLETARKVEVVARLDFGRCRLAVAVPEDAEATVAEDVEDGCTVATCFPRLTEAYFAKLGKRVNIAEVSGATELAPQIGLAEVITDLTETGSTLKLNHLREIGVVVESMAVLIANPKALSEKGARIEEVRGAIESVMSAARKRYVMANVPRAVLDQLSTLLPGVSGPTVMNIMGREDMVAIHAVADEAGINGVITMLKSVGATGILVMPIERMVV